MPNPCATVAIPTLKGGALLQECLASLDRQTRCDFDVIVVDNSGTGIVRKQGIPDGVRVIENQTNAGYGGAVNQAAALSQARFLAVLNDDTTVAPEWMEAMIAAAESEPGVGMCAAKVILASEGVLDSAGMLLCRDGSSKQRGHGRPPVEFGTQEEVLLPSGSAALYRRDMFLELGGFDESFFLYCEDTDLGLRAQRAGWKCLYVPRAEVQHHYSSTAGRVSLLKAFYVERNRLFLVGKNFPLRMLWQVPGATLARYFWHLMAIREGKGAAASFYQGNPRWQLLFLIVRAHWSFLANGWRLHRDRRRIARNAKLTTLEFLDLCRRYEITPRQVAAQ